MQNDRSGGDRQVWLDTLELSLRRTPDSLGLLFERAKTLDALGRDAQAEQAYLDVLKVQADHFGALNDLGLLLCRLGKYEPALERFQAAVAAAPGNAVGHANLAYVLLRGNNAAAASAAYTRALELDPENIEAHRGAAVALRLLGRSNEAQEHLAKGVDAAPVTTLKYRGTADPVPLLLLVSTSSANTPFERMIDSRTFLVHKLTVEGAGRLSSLPEHRLAVNAVGDVDASPEGVDFARRTLARSHAPVVNHPDHIASTGRRQNAQRLANIPGVQVARIERVERETLSDPAAASRLTAMGFQWPLLLRSIGYHTGEHFVRVEAAAQLSHTARKLPGRDLFVMAFLDLRNAQGSYTKFRMMMVGGKLYPLHAVVSAAWKVHFFSADMGKDAAYRELDALFLEQPQMVVGERAMTQLHAIATELDLDYGGIDFSIDAEGNVVVFEANATMVLAQPGTDAMWDYRRPAVANITAAVHDLLLAKSAVRQLSAP